MPADLLVDGDLTLRRAVPGDAADIVEVYSETDTRHWMLWDRELPDLAEALANIERSETAWSDGWGGVLATRAVLMVADWGFREHRLMRVFLRADPANASSAALAERAGFTYEGTERESAVYPDTGRRFDSRLLAAAIGADHHQACDRGRRRLPHRHRDGSDRRPGPLPSGPGPCGAPCRLPRVEPRAGPRRGPGQRDVGDRGVRRRRRQPRVVRTPGLVELAGLQLLPAHQSRGIGARIVRDLMAEAASSGRGFGLEVEKDNPRARALYERLGLTVVGEDGDEWVMRLPTSTR